MQEIKLKKGMQFKVVKKVYIIDNSYNMPSVGTLLPGTIVEVVGHPTHISDVPIAILSGGGSITQRNLHEPDQYREIKPGKGYFFSQVHKTNSPYDFGTLSSSFYEIQNTTK